MHAPIFCTCTSMCKLITWLLTSFVETKLTQTQMVSESKIYVERAHDPSHNFFNFTHKEVSSRYLHLRDVGDLSA
jgi:hypothetical protein